MDHKTYTQLKHLLLAGLIASVVTVIGGELPIGWTAYPEGDNYILSMILGCGNLSVLQLACGVFFGGIGIPLQYYGFEAVARITEMGGSRKCARLIHWGGLACAFWGGIVHVICVALMFICKILETQGMTALPQPILDFTVWLVMPISVVFMPIYYAMTIAMAVAVAKGRTIFPKWAAVFNPLVATVILNILPEIAPNTPLVNALGMANMGIGSLMTFAGLLALLVKYYRNHSNKGV